MIQDDSCQHNFDNFLCNGKTIHFFYYLSKIFDNSDDFGCCIIEGNGVFAATSL